MVDFKAGDRVVKMSGVAAGKYGTVNSVLDNGTLNVTFDGERRPRYCDPERCGQVAANAKIVTQDNFGTLRVGDHVDFRKSRYWKGTGVVTRVYGDGIIDVKGDRGEGEMEIHEEDILNSRAANAVARNAGRFELVEHNMGRTFGVYDSATKGYIADDIPLRDALRILKSKGETAEQAKKGLDWVAPGAVDKLW